MSKAKDTPISNTDKNPTNPKPGREVDVVNPEDWGCKQSYGTDIITDEVYTDLSGSSQNFGGTPSIESIVDEQYSWGYSGSDLSSTSNQNFAHEVSVVHQPSQQNTSAAAHEVRTAEPPSMF